MRLGSNLGPLVPLTLHFRPSPRQEKRSFLPLLSSRLRSTGHTEQASSCRRVSHEFHAYSETYSARHKQRSIAPAERVPAQIRFVDTCCLYCRDDIPAPQSSRPEWLLA